jgi:hypothetical protein
MVAEAAIATPSVRTFKIFFIFLFLPSAVWQRSKTYPKLSRHAQKPSGSDTVPWGWFIALLSI